MHIKKAKTHRSQQEIAWSQLTDNILDLKSDYQTDQELKILLKKAENQS